MTIQLTDAGKRFNRDWIFRHLDASLEPGSKHAITGPNGSGKSTLLQVLGGSMNLNEGNITFSLSGKVIPPDDIYQYIAIAAPYLELVEEMAAAEFLRFHTVFKPLALPVKEILEIVGLSGTGNKQIRNFSSGMKQRLKLAQAIFSDVPVILLDEPCTNLDKTGIELYQQLIQRYCGGRTIIVSSNDPNEYAFCDRFIHIPDHRSQPVRP